MSEKKENPKKQSSQDERARWLGPVLDALRDLGSSGRIGEVIDKVALNEEVTDIEREKLLKDGRPAFDNKIKWAREFLFFAGLLDNSERGTWVLTKAGQETHLDMEQSLEIMKRYRESKKRRAESFEENQPIDKSDEVMETPLLEILKRVDPKKFELLCLLLLREHGFDDVTVTPYSHDEGIDVFGTLKTTPFVSMKVAFQCKRYNDKNPISRSHVDDFRGSISGKAEKGGIITTGRFSREAMDSANRQGTLPIELIDGQRLVELFEEVSLGLKPKQVYEIDYSFFDQYM